ncbi:hypothetical protein V6N13_088826 [Hibiscus sabdariffa]
MVQQDGSKDVQPNGWTSGGARKVYREFYRNIKYMDSNPNKKSKANRKTSYSIEVVLYIDGHETSAKSHPLMVKASNHTTVTILEHVQREDMTSLKDHSSLMDHSLKDDDFSLAISHPDNMVKGVERVFERSVDDQ